MPTTFDTNFVDDNDDIIHANHLTQFKDPINNLESGSALYSNDNGTLDSYKVDFSSGNELSGPTPEVGRVINFKANLANGGPAEIVITGPGGDLDPIPLRKKDNSELQAGDIAPGQVLSAVYVEDDQGLDGRFQLLGFFDSRTQVGDVLYTSDSSVPGFLPAAGQILDQASYPELLSRIGLLKDGPPKPQSWTERRPTHYYLRDMVYGNGLYVAVGDYGVVLTSQDGLNWTFRASQYPLIISGITYANGLFYAITGYDTVEKAILTSPDGVSWNYNAVPELYSGFNGIFYLERVFFLSGAGKLWRSLNGISDWQPVLQTNGASKLAFGNGVFVAVTDYNDTVYWSTDGINWTSAGSQAGRSVSFGAGKFVAVGFGGKIRTSTDGITWTAQTPPGSNALTKVIYSDGLFVAFGSFEVWYSRNGGTFWTVAASLTAGGSFTGAASAEGRIAACSSYGYTVVSDRDFSYNPYTQFKMPELPSPGGAESLKPWIRAL